MTKKLWVAALVLAPLMAPADVWAQAFFRNDQPLTFQDGGTDFMIQNQTGIIGNVLDGFNAKGIGLEPGAQALYLTQDPAQDHPASAAPRFPQAFRTWNKVFELQQLGGPLSGLSFADYGVWNQFDIKTNAFVQSAGYASGTNPTAFNDLPKTGSATYFGNWVAAVPAASNGPVAMIALFGNTPTPAVVAAFVGLQAQPVFPSGFIDSKTGSYALIDPRFNFDGKGMFYSSAAETAGTFTMGTTKGAFGAKVAK